MVNMFFALETKNTIFLLKFSKFRGPRPSFPMPMHTVGGGL